MRVRIEEERENAGFPALPELPLEGVCPHAMLPCLRCRSAPALVDVRAKPKRRSFTLGAGMASREEARWATDDGSGEPSLASLPSASESEVSEPLSLEGLSAWASEGT